MEATEWPSAHKIERLREQGLAPYNSMATACLVAAALFICGLFLSGILKETVSLLGTLLARERIPSVSPEEKKLVFHNVGLLLCVPAGAAFAAFLLSGLLQTRFLFRLQSLAPAFNRLNPFKFPSGMAILRAAGTAGLVHACALLAGAIFAYFALSDVIGLLNQGREFLLKWPGRSLRGVAPYALIALGLCFMAFWLLGKLQFSQRNRMSRLELAQEAREET